MPTCKKIWMGVFLVASISTACGDQATTGDWVTVRDTLPSGTVRVANEPSADASPTWNLVEELRVGAVDGRGPDTFGQLKGLVVLDGGGFAVLESQAQEVRVFGPDGEHLATHGRRGEGPGEFRDANGLMLDPGGRLWVPDARNARVSVLDAADGFVEFFPFGDGHFGWVWSGAMAEDGRIFRFSRESGGLGNMLRVYDATMTQVDSLPLPGRLPGGDDYDPASAPGAFYVETGGGFAMFAIPFYPTEVRYIDPGGAVWSGTAGDPSYRIRKFRPGGDTTLVVEMGRPAVPVPTAERDSVVDGLRETFGRMGVTPDWSRIPTVKPALEDIFQSAEGNLWVRTPSPGGEPTFDVFSPDGSYLGTASAAIGLKVLSWLSPVVQGDAFWVVVTDELDVPHVLRLRITPAE